MPGHYKKKKKDKKKKKVHIWKKITYLVQIWTSLNYRRKQPKK